MAQKYRRTLSKLFVFNLLIPLLIFVAVSVVIGVLNYNRAFEAERVRLETVSQNVAQELDTFLREYGQLLRDVTRLDPLVELLPRLEDLDEELYFSDEFAVARQILASLAEEDGVDVLYAASADAPGLLANTWVSLPPDYDARTRPWYEQTANQRSLYVTDPYLTADAELDNQLVISLAHPIEREGRLLGVAAMDTGFGIIDEIAERANEDHRMHVTLFSLRNNEIIWNDSQDRWGQSLSEFVQDLGYSQEESPGVISRIENDPAHYFEGVAAQTDGDAMIQSVRIPLVEDWGLLLFADKGAVGGQIVAAVVQPLMIAGLVFIAVLAFGFGISAVTILKPLNFVSSSLGNLSGAEGDLTVSVEVNTKDDIQRLADNFNQFVGRMQAMVTRAQGAAEDETVVFNELTASITETNAAMHEIVTNIESIGSQIARLDDSVSTSVSSVEEISQSIRSMVDQINTQASMVEQSSASITEMMSSINNVAQVTDRKAQSVESLNEAASRGKQQLQTMNTRFHEGVVQRMDEIREMTSAIENIAAQTNLLSMNAAIEAAHAGDAGKGFAVVAEEIRKLADESGHSSKQISTSLKSILSAIDETRENAATTEHEFDLITTEVAETKDAFLEINETTRELRTGAEEITNAVSELNTVTSRIKSGSDEIQVGTTGMLDTQNTVKEISGSVSQGIQEIITGSAEVRKTMNALTEENHRLEQAIAVLNEELSRFKTE